MSGDGWRPWRAAMAEALYGPAGFYRSAGAPARHFRTAAHTGAAWTEALGRLLTAVDEQLGRPAGFTVVDLGAGSGELLVGLATEAPDRWDLVAVDIAPRPAALPARIGWAQMVPDDVVGVLMAVEWLDVVPVDVVELTDTGPVLVEVDSSGAERLGASPSPEQREWLDRWWPLAEVGDRAEVGLPRDAAWADACRQLRCGLALAVDYGVVPGRDVAGTLTGFRGGRQVAPVPDGSMDLTAHVLFESIAAAAEPDVETALLTQRDALRGLGLNASRPAYDDDPSRYLAALSRAGDEAELLDRSGLGGFTWLVQAVGTAVPAEVRGSRP